MFHGKGQINMESSFGREIYNICSNPNYKNVFEVGTWNGQGSTVCIMNAIINKPNSCLYSLEACPDKYAEAIAFWKFKPHQHKLNLINGILHKQSATESDIREVCSGTIPCYNEHYIPEVKMLTSNKVINIDSISDIDIVLLDGGEYTTRGDYEVLLRKNPKVILLDDSAIFKCKQIRQALLDNSQWTLYKENLHDRHGWSIFIRS
jgi:hypothetical protein